MTGTLRSERSAAPGLGVKEWGGPTSLDSPKAVFRWTPTVSKPSVIWVRAVVSGQEAAWVGVPDASAHRNMVKAGLCELRS